jgi:hypothetical protein
MARGDQIYVMRPFVGLNGVYEHHGIDCGDGTVIHYSKATEPATVRRTSMAAFTRGESIYRKTYAVHYIPDLVLERAESRLGEQRYNLLSNNCEHFATWCKTGRSESLQLAAAGLDASRLSESAAGRLLQEAIAEGTPQQTQMLFQQADHNIQVARQPLEAKYDQLQSEIVTWQRVAHLALQKGREDLARAALHKKVALKQQVNELEQQLDHLDELQASLDRNRDRASGV